VPALIAAHDSARDGGWVTTDAVHDASAFVGKDHEREQQAIGGGRHHENVGGHHQADVGSKKRPPRLRRWPSAIHHVRRDGGLSHGDPIFRSSPWMRGALQSGFARDISRINSRTSAGTGAVAALPGPEQVLSSQLGLTVAKQSNARQKSRGERSPEESRDWDTSTSTLLWPWGAAQQSSHRAPPLRLQ